MTFQRVSGKSQLPTPTQIAAAGTSEGVKKSWESRSRRRKRVRTQMETSKSRRMKQASDRATRIRKFREETLEKRQS